MASRIRLFSSTLRRRRSQAGFALVETLIFVPIIFLMTFLALEVTNILRVYETMSWIAEYGVRQASEGLASDDSGRINRRIEERNLKNKIFLKLFELGILGPKTASRIRVCVNYFSEDENPDRFEYCNRNHVPVAEQQTYEPGDFVRVTVETLYSPFLPGLLPESLKDVPLRATFTRVISVGW